MKVAQVMAGDGMQQKKLVACVMSSFFCARLNQGMQGVDNNNKYGRVHSSIVVRASGIASVYL